jgi:acetyl esterase/lipase
MLRQQGVTVIAVEFRTGSRFDAGPLEQLADARAAYRYVRAHATALGVDSTRVGVAGFSSGAGLALTLGTRGVTDRTPAPPPADRVYPAAVIVTGACVDPAGPREDGYFRKMVQRAGSPRDVSPVHLLARGQPPTLIVQATKDEYCAYEDAQTFVTRSRALGNDAHLESIEGATHFFGFYFRPGLEQMRSAISAALLRWGWNGAR